MSTGREAVTDWTPFDEVAEREERKMRELYLPESGLFDWRQIRALGNFAASDPARWRTIAAKLDDPEATCRELARRLKISKSTVSDHLKRMKIG